MPRKVIRQIVPGAPGYWDIVMLPPTHRRLRRFLSRGHFMLEVPKKRKPTEEEIAYARRHGIKVPPINERVMQYASEEFLAKPLDESQKRSLRNAIQEELDGLYKKQGIAYRSKLVSEFRFTNLRDVFANAQLAEVFRREQSDPQMIEFSDGIRSAIVKVAIAFMLREHFRAKGIQATIPLVLESAKRFMLGRAEKSSMYAVSREYVTGVERELLRHNREARKKAHEEAARNARQVHGQLDPLRRKLGRFAMSRKDRKELITLLRRQVLEKGTTDAAYVRSLTLKRARAHLVEQLKAAGFNPEQVLNRLGVDRSDSGVKRMKSIAIVLQKTPFVERAAKISKWLDRVETPAATMHSTAPVDKSLSRPKGQPRSDEEKRRERKEREARRVTPAPAPIQKPKPVEVLPETFPAMVRLMESSQSVTHEMYARLKNLLSDEAAKKPAKQNRGLMRRAMRMTILSFIATEYGLSGRLHEDFLKKKYNNRLHLLVDECVAELIREGYLEYEQHLGHKRNIALTRYSSETGILQKYSSKKTR